MKGMVRFLLTLCLMTVLTGCLSIERDTAQRSEYLIEPQRGEAPVRETLAPLLAVETFEVSPAYAGHSLLLRKPGNRIESDYYHRFFLPPGRMLAGAARGWLAGSGLFGRVVGDGEAELLLEATVEELYGDFRGEPSAVLTIHGFLSRGGELLWHRRYALRRPVERKSPEGLVRALEAAYADFLTQLESDLSEALYD